MLDQKLERINVFADVDSLWDSIHEAVIKTARDVIGTSQRESETTVSMKSEERVIDLKNCKAAGKDEIIV